MKTFARLVLRVLSVLALAPGLSFIGITRGADMPAAGSDTAPSDFQRLLAAGLVAPGARVRELGSGFGFTEGPTAARDGSVYFTDQPRNRIHRWEEAAGVSTVLEPAYRSNGMAFDAAGSLVLCAEEVNALKRRSPDGALEILAAGFEGRPLNGPNDVWVAPDGALFFTDPFYPRKWGRHQSAPQDVQAVYRFGPDGSLRRVATDLRQPNGIVGSPDGTHLYVADIGSGRTWRFRIGADGELQEKTLLCELGSDGMALDERGNVYLTGRGGVTVVSPEGAVLGKIPVPGSWTANVCFGGAHRDLLFITATQAIFGVQMAVRGP